MTKAPKLKLNTLGGVLFSITIGIAVLAGCAGLTTTPTIAVKQGNVTEPQVIVSPNDHRKYRSITLPNQLQVMLVSDPEAERSSAALSVDVGWLQDPEGQPGLAHFLEHMLLLGTKRFPEPESFMRFMNQHGGGFNATTNQLTHYMFEVGHQQYDEALDRFAEFFKNPLLLPEQVDKERHAVHSEWSMLQNQDFWARRALAGKLLGEHPANRFVVGNLDTLGDKETSTLHAEMKSFYQQYYSANMMKLVLISSQSLEDIAQLAYHYFVDIENKNLISPRVKHNINFSNIGPRRLHYVPNRDIQELRLDFTIDNNMEQFSAKPGEFLSHLLRSQMPGTLSERLKAEGLINNLYVYTQPNQYGNYGSFQVVLNLTESGMLQRETIVARTMQYIELVRRQGIDDKYYQEIHTALQNQFTYLEKIDGFRYASQLSVAMQYYPLQSVISAPYEYNRFDAAAIQHLLQQLIPERLTIWYISKNEPTEHRLSYFNGLYSVKPVPAHELRNWQGIWTDINLPALNRFQPQDFTLKHPLLSQPEKVVDEARVEAWLMGSQFFREQPRGQLLLQWYDPKAKKDAISALMHGLWTSQFFQQNHALTLEAKEAGVTIELLEERDFIIKLSGFTDQKAKLVEQLAAGMQLKLNEQQFKQGVDVFVRAARSQQQTHQFRQVIDLLRTVTTPGRYEMEQLLFFAESLTLADFDNYVNNSLARSSIRVFAFGNYDEQDIQQISKYATATLPVSAHSPTYQTPKRWQPESKMRLSTVREHPQRDVSLIRAQYHPTPGYAEQAAAGILVGHLQPEFFNQLRNEEKLGYMVNVSNVTLSEHAGLAFIVQSPVLAASALQQRVDQFLLQYNEKLQQLTDEDFLQLKQGWLLELQRRPNNLEEEVATFRQDWLYNRQSFDSKQQLISAVEQATLADAQRFYQQAVIAQTAPAIQVMLAGETKRESVVIPLTGFTELSKLDEFHQAILD
ncbi:hypothetical protein WG68_07960 [Arsukibacterium ikkense]|uniref:Protease 3 n=1 Tax=Arsukibacterium ikkense TaxID=336831 RepID=A0A0M2V4Y9_9GAMM|nr:insulinase family protein [Arsukibacterium ikkense]KKO45932.1 hypothetical protein WG68_07960 [Arsukibacterium ikkense]